MHRIYDTIDTVKRYYPDADTDLIYRAYVFAAKMHRGQTRLSGEPYLSHPIEVAVILANMKMDVVTVATGLLHDVLEDTATTVEQLTELFGHEVAQLVDGVTKIEKIHFTSREDYHAENLRKMLLAMAKDIRVLIVKLADRLHNVRTLKYASEEQQQRVARETLDIYAPLANRLGLGVMKSELEDHAFIYLEPDIYKQLLEYTNDLRTHQQKTIDRTKEELEKKLQEHEIEATISGRQKHLYSIYRKMNALGISFKEVMDVIGLRVITNSTKDCYATLGIVHSTWKQIPNTFDDYISLPKPNMYQSLHTAVIGPLGKPVEIQIRSWEMHLLAEEGIAAHWRYKEGKAQDEDDDAKVFGLRHLLELQQEFTESSEFVEHLKIDLYPDEVFVFTPQGEVKCLPKGATPVDFAYAVHTEVGHCCAGAKINERMVPLRTPLNNGDIVEILTHKSHHPAKDWLSFITTGKAKAKIKQFFNAKQREEEIQIGTEVVEKALRKKGRKLVQVQKDGTLKRVAAELNCGTEEDLFAVIAIGKVSMSQVLEKIFPKPNQGTPEQKQEELEAKLKESIESAKEKASRSGSAIKVNGMNDLLTRFGHCCKPLPGDPIVGYITRGRGITIHSLNCPNIKALEVDDDRLIEVEWETNPENHYPAGLYITGRGRESLFADIISVISKTNALIVTTNSELYADQLEVRCVVNVLGRAHLNDVIQNVRKIKAVIDVRQDRFIA